MDDNETRWQRDELERKLCHAEGLLRQYPTDPQLNREVAYLLYCLGRYEESLQYYRNVVTAEPENASAWYEVGHTALLAGSFAIGEEALRTAITLGRDDAGARAALATALRKLGRPAAAIQLARTALEATPDPSFRSRLHRVIGTWFGETGDLEGALVHLQEAAEGDPYDPVAQQNLGIAYLWREQFAAAISRLSMAVMLCPDDGTAWDYLGRAARRTGALETARSAFERALALGADSGRLRAELAWVLAQTGEVASAIEQGSASFTQSLSPEEAAWVHTILAHGWAQMGDREAELRHLREAVAIAPEGGDAQRLLGFALSQRDSFDEAVLYLRNAAASFPDDADLWLELGFAASQAGEYAEAEAALEKAISLGGENVAARKELVDVYFLTERWDRAIEEGQRLLAATADGAIVAWLHRVLSDCCGRTGNAQDAIQHLEEVIRLTPGEAEDHFNLGVEHHRLGNSVAAVAEVRKAVALASSDERMSVFLGQLLVETGEYLEGERVLVPLLHGECRGAALVNLVTCFTAQNRVHEAVKLAEAAVSASPEEATAWVALSLALGGIGDNQRAAEAMAAAKLRDPENPWVAAVASLR